MEGEGGGWRVRVEDAVGEDGGCSGRGWRDKGVRVESSGVRVEGSWREGGGPR